MPTRGIQPTLYTTWKPPPGTWLQLQRPLPRHGHFLVYWGIWREFILCIEITSRSKPEQKLAELAAPDAAQGPRAVPGSFAGRQDAVRGHARPSQQLSSGLARKGGHHSAPCGKKHHDPRHPQARDEAEVCRRRCPHCSSFHREAWPCPAGTAPALLAAPLPRSHWARIMHQRRTSAPRVSTQMPREMQDRTTGQTRFLLEAPSTNTGNPRMHRHPQTLPEQCCARPRCSIPKLHAVPTAPPEQHKGCPTSLAVAAPQLTSQLLLPEPGQPSAPSAAGAGPAGRIQPPPPSLHFCAAGAPRPRQHEPQLGTAAGREWGWMGRLQGKAWLSLLQVIKHSQGTST